MTTEPQADIVERLERFHEHHGIGGTLIIEAAAEITRLRAQVKIVQAAAKTIMIHEADELRQLREERQQWSHAIKSLDSERDANAVLTDEVERLRAELAEARLHGRREGLEAAASWLREKEGAWRWLTSNYPSIGAPHVPRVLADQVLAIAPPTLMKDAGHGHA